MEALLSNSQFKPTVNRLREIFTYCSESGILVRKSTGKPVGSHEDTGYLQVSIEGWRGRVHQVAFAMYNGFWSEFSIDHVNRDRSDNRGANLRSATHSENMSNVQKFSYSIHGKFRATIEFRGRRMHLGCYDSKAEADSILGFADVMLNKKFASDESKAIVKNALLRAEFKS